MLIRLSVKFDSMQEISIGLKLGDRHQLVTQWYLVMSLDVDFSWKSILVLPKGSLQTIHAYNTVISSVLILFPLLSISSDVCVLIVFITL